MIFQNVTFIFIFVIVMLLFEYKQYLQSYDTETLFFSKY